MARLSYFTRLVGNMPTHCPAVRPAHPLFHRWQLAAAHEPTESITANPLSALPALSMLPLRFPLKATPIEPSADEERSSVRDQSADSAPPASKTALPPQEITSLSEPLETLLRRALNSAVDSRLSTPAHPGEVFSNSPFAPLAHQFKRLDRPRISIDATIHANETHRPDSVPTQLATTSVRAEATHESDAAPTQSPQLSTTPVPRSEPSQWDLVSAQKTVQFSGAQPVRQILPPNSRQIPISRPLETPSAPSRSIMLEPQPLGASPKGRAEPPPRQRGGIRIGFIDIHIQPPPMQPQPAPRSVSPQRTGPLARGFSSSFGLRQG